MATVMTRPAADRPRTTRRIYLPIALACLVIALLVFRPTYFEPLLVGIPHPLPITHVHPAVFLGWIALMILQAWIAAS